MKEAGVETGWSRTQADIEISLNRTQAIIEPKILSYTRKTLGKRVSFPGTFELSKSAQKSDYVTPKAKKKKTVADVVCETVHRKKEGFWINPKSFFLFL